MSAIQECVQQIQNAVQQLRSLVHGCSTSSVALRCFTFHLFKGTGQEFDTRLSAPAKQCSFLLGILLESQEPDAPLSFSEEDWHKAEHLLEQVFLAYLPLYFPTQEELGSLSKEWHRVYSIAMGSFLHFFNSGLLATGEQIAARIRRYLTPFDEYLFQTLGISQGDRIILTRLPFL